MTTASSDAMTAPIRAHLPVLGVMTLSFAAPVSANACDARPPAIRSQFLLSEFTQLRDVGLAGLDHCDWQIVTSNWGGRTNDGDYSGGVIAANVHSGPDGLILKANGNAYQGPLRGRNSDGTTRPDGRRTGAALKSRHRFEGGRFEICTTIPPELGVVSAFWTFRYEERGKLPPSNHEIDIEFPGQKDADTPVDLDHVNLTTWVGLGSREHTTSFRALSSRASDGKFHLLRFDWTPPSKTTEGQVDFYIDNQSLGSITKTVPSLPGEVWFGLWFPPVWAGIPEFDVAEMRIKWVRVTPSLEPLKMPRNDLQCE